VGYTDVIIGRQTWSDYVTGLDTIHGFEAAVQRQVKTLQVGLPTKNFQIALESGLGALSDDLSRGLESVSNNIELSLTALEDGIDRLHADFNLLMGEVVLETRTPEKVFNFYIGNVAGAARYGSQGIT
jgi:hypothetical protein